MRNIKKMRLGVTLVELILSIAIIGIIVVSFMPLFVMSSKTNSKSEITLDSTYIGKDIMELIYSEIRNYKDNDFDKLTKYLDGEIKKEDNKYIEVNGKDNTYRYKDSKYIKIEYKEDDNLINVIIRVYKDEEMNQLEVQYESLYPWKESGNISEE